MKTRLVLATAVLGGLSLAASTASAAPAAVLDGKKTKVLTLKGTGSQQFHDTDITGGPERVECAPPRCARLDFVYKPAKGVTGDVLFEATWTNPASDVDLYVAALDKSGFPTEIGSCGASTGTSEKVFLDASSFKKGNKYALIIDFYRTASEAVTATATMPGTNTISTSFPAAVESGAGIHVNCGL